MMPPSLGSDSIQTALANLKSPAFSKSYLCNFCSNSFLRLLLSTGRALQFVRLLECHHRGPEPPQRDAKKDDRDRCESHKVVRPHDLKARTTNAITADQKARLRTLKDLDQSAAALAEACQLLLDPDVPDKSLRKKVFAKIPRAALENALERVSVLIRPPDDVYYQELSEHYRSVRGYLPHVLTHISFEAAPAGRPLLAACDWLRDQQNRKKPDNNAPREVIDKAWQRYVVQKDGCVDIRAFTFCVLSHLQTAIHRRDVYTRPSWRYADPRANLLSDAEWEATRPIVCRTLGLPPDPQPILDSLVVELDKTYREVARRLPDNPDVRFEKVKGKEELILTPLDALDEPLSLIQLRKVVAERLPRVELAELVLEVALRAGFTEAFTHLTDRSARTADFALSLCAALLAEACNTGRHFDQEIIILCGFWKAFRPIRRFRAPRFELTGPMPYTALQSMFDALYPPGMQWYWSGDFLGDIPDKAIDEHLKFGAQLPSLQSTMHFYPVDAAAGRVGRNDTAFSYRDAKWSMVIVGVDPEPANAEKVTTWTKDYWAAVHPYSPGGAYVNFMMDEGIDRIKATYRDNYDRLVEMKRKYDPDNFFHVNQNIKPK
jgi:Berberine and berberine like/Tn3 transposase DDE domain